MADNLYLPLDLQTKQAEMQRKQKLAQAMLGAVQAPQAQMVGGQYIAPGILGQAVPLIKALMGQKLENDASSEQSKFLSENAARIGTMGQPADLIKQKHIDPTSIQTYAQGGGDKSLQRASPEIKKKYTGATRYAEDGKTLQAEVEYPDKTTGWETKNAGTSINFNDKLYDTEELKLHSDNAKALQAVRTRGSKAMSLVNKLEEVKGKVMSGNTYTGPTSIFQAQAAAFLNEFTGKQFDGAAATDYLNRLKNEGLAELIAGASGRQLTDADVKMLATQYAGSFDSPETFQLFLADMKRMAEKDLAEYDAGVRFYSNMPGRLGDTMRGFLNAPTAGSSVLETPLEGDAAKSIRNPTVSDEERNAPADPLRLPPNVRWER